MKLFQLLETVTDAERREKLRYQDYLEELLGDDWEVRFNYDGIFKIETFPNGKKVTIDEIDFLDLISKNFKENEKEIKNMYKGVLKVDMSNGPQGPMASITFKDAQSAILMLLNYCGCEDDFLTMKNLKNIEEDYCAISRCLKNAILS